MLRRRRPSAVEDSRMSLVGHLQELRRRLLISLMALIVVTLVVAVAAYHPIFHLLRQPYCDLPANKRTGGIGCQLIFTHPTDAFFVRLKVSLIAGVLLSAPVWLSQLWGFITPGLHQHERRWATTFLLASLTLFAMGATVAYLVLRPALNVLLGFGGDGVVALLEVTQYLSFITTILLIFGVSFEFPLVIVLLNLAGVLSSARLRSSRRVAIFLLFLFAGVATPTQDPVTMLALAVPLCLLFEASVLVTRWNDRRRARLEAESEWAGLADDQPTPTPTAQPTPLPQDAPDASEPDQRAGVGSGTGHDDTT